MHALNIYSGPILIYTKGYANTTYRLQYGDLSLIPVVVSPLAYPESTVIACILLYLYSWHIVYNQWHRAWYVHMSTDFWVPPCPWLCFLCYYFWICSSKAKWLSCSRLGSCTCCCCGRRTNCSTAADPTHCSRGCSILWGWLSSGNSSFLLSTSSLITNLMVPSSLISLQYIMLV